MDAILATYDAGTFLRLFNYNQNPQELDEVFSYKTAQADKYYPHTDMLGSVTAVSDSTGTSQASWTYDVYGTRTQTSGSLVYAFGFTGREHDGDTGLIYSRDRYYDPSVGSWISADRLGFMSGPNLYQYVMDRPTLLTDPTGFAPNGLFGLSPDVQAILELVIAVAVIAATFAFLGTPFGWLAIGGAVAGGAINATGVGCGNLLGFANGALGGSLGSTPIGSVLGSVGAAALNSLTGIGSYPNIGAEVGAAGIFSAIGAGLGSLVSPALGALVGIIFGELSVDFAGAFQIFTAPL